MDQIAALSHISELSVNATCLHRFGSGYSRSFVRTEVRQSVDPIFLKVFGTFHGHDSALPDEGGRRRGLPTRRNGHEREIDFQASHLFAGLQSRDCGNGVGITRICSEQ
jgi:hypothetical protein